MRRKSCRPAALCLILLAAPIIFFCGCNRAGSKSGNNASAAPSPKKPLTAFESDLEYVRKGQFTFVYVIARPDNGVLTKDDITYLKENTPRDTNQWVATDENRRVIAGTNFEFTPENLDALRKRFTVEDYSGK